MANVEQQLRSWMLLERASDTRSDGLGKSGASEIAPQCNAPYLNGLDQ
jgi:hypothetical protein